MAPLSLKIILDEGAVTRTVKFTTKNTVREAHAIVKDKVIVKDPSKEYALFLRSTDNELSGIWLENHRTLDYYMLRDGDSLDYICKVRNLRVKLLDGSVKTLQVNEGKTVSELMESICGRLGITNHDEYGLCPEEEDKPEEPKDMPHTGTLTLGKRKHPPKERDEMLDKLSKKIQTDDNVEWLDQHRTLRELGVDSTATVILKRRLFYSDRNVDARDPVQLNLLYVQTRDAILNGHHLVTEEQAAEFAGIQCQIHFEDFQEDKHKPGFIENLSEYLPEQYIGVWGIEKKLLKQYQKHKGLSPLDAKSLYIKTARDLPTYGVTFFLVKEKQKDKKKLVPRLLGINSEAILRLDENTKEILQQWPLTHVKTYHVGKSGTFTLNFGDYSDKEYCCKTQDAYRIRDILEGYIDLIRRRMLSRPAADPGDSMAICQDNIQHGQSHMIQFVQNSASKPMTETFVGPNRIISYDQGQSAQQGTQMMTMQQIIRTNQMNNPQNAKMGAVASASEAAQPIEIDECANKLKRMNSTSVQIVTLLTDPTEANIQNSQMLAQQLQANLPAVENGVKATARKQTIEESKKMLLDEMQDLVNYVNKLTACTQPGQVDTSEAKDAAEKIAALTTDMYCSVDPNSVGRSEVLRRSKNSIIAGEKKDMFIRRESFMAASSSALTGIDHALHAVEEEYRGPAIEEEQARRLEKALQDRMGKLNAALALYLTAHSDPDNIDYAAAIDSMNTINELMPKIARDAQMLGSTKDPVSRKELQDDLRTLLDGAKKLCSLTGTDDHEKVQEAANSYADIADKLIFKFARGKNAQKEDEIIELAKEAGAKTSLLLMSAEQLKGTAPDEPAAEEVDRAGVKSAAAARDLLACALLTAPAIHEPHCQSALTAAAEGLSSSVQRLSARCRPLAERPGHGALDAQLHQQEMDVYHALDRLKDAYATLGGADDESLPLKERQRLKFVCSLSGAKNNLQPLPDTWGNGPGGAVSPQQQEEARRRLAQQIAQLNAAIAALAAATADPDNVDYGTAQLALNTISELMPQITKESEAVAAGQDEATRASMKQQLASLCDATRDLCNNVENLDDMAESAGKFAAASSKLSFLISPGSDKAKEKQITQLSSKAYDNASDLLANAHRLKEKLTGPAAAEIDYKGADADCAARSLVTVAQVTAPSIGEARCSDAMASAVEQLRRRADELSAACYPHLKPGSEEMQEMHHSQRQLHNSLAELLGACQVDDSDNVGMTPELREKKRLQFVKTMGDAKKRLSVAEKQMKEPLACTMMREEDGAVLQQQLSDRLAQLNAAVAALARATADRDNPDYEAAQKAVNTITELMPQLVRETCVLASTKDGEEQKKLLQQVKQICDASKDIIDNAGDPQSLNEAAAKFSEASSKLGTLVNPRRDNKREQQIIDLSAGACVRASELLSQVQALTQQVRGAPAEDLDCRGARTADAAQALLTTAQVTAPTISSPHCSAALVAAAEHLRGSAKDLTTACSPHVTPGQKEQLQLQNSQQQLEASLDKLVKACQAVPALPAKPGVLPKPQDKQRLHFINSLSGAKSCFDDAQHQLSQPVVSTTMREEDGAVLQQQLSDRLAQLNAAVAALARATADRENPDYASAQEAVNTISTLMPQLVQEAKTLSGTKDGAAQAQLIQQVQQLCEASKAICDNAGQPQGLSEAAAKFSDASGKLKFILSPARSPGKEKQIMDLSTGACVRASELLSQVQALTQQVRGAPAEDLDCRGARTADAAQALLTTAQVTFPTISSPKCAVALVSAAEHLRDSAAELTDACRPHLPPGHKEQQHLQASHQQLDDSLDKLVQACQDCSGIRVVLSPEQREKQRLQFVNSLSGAKSCFDQAQQHLKQPIASSSMREEDGAVLQQQLSDRLAQLNAAVAALARATADREHPDYASAQRAVDTISTLMPQLVQDTRKLCGVKEGAAQQSLLQQVQQLCDASDAICHNAGQPQGLSDAAAKFSDASGKLMFTLSPSKSLSKEKEIMDLSAGACVTASELLSQVQALTQQVQGAPAEDLDSRGARTADAAQALLTTAQVTSSTISSPKCAVALVSAAEQLRGSAADLTSACRPHLAPGQKEQQHLQASHQQLDDTLDKLVQACQDCSGIRIVLSPEQREKQRLQFVNSLSGAKSCFDQAQQHLKQPVVCSMMREEDGAVLQQQLSDRLAQLNAAVAALARATADRENPDYVSAQRAVDTISTLMPQVAQDTRKLCGVKEGAAQQSLLQQVQQLCDASDAICHNAGQPQGLSDAAAKFGDASGKLMFTLTPTKSPGKEKQIMDLSAGACVRASELLSQVQALTQQVQGASAEDLDARGARTADAAQALLTTAQVTSPTISSPKCAAALVSAAEHLRGSAAELTTACRPHLPPGHKEQQHLQVSHQQLDDSLDKLVQACQECSGIRVVLSPEQREKQRLQFVNSLSGAKSCFDQAQKHLKQPIASSSMREEDGAVLQQQLSDRLAQLNAAVAALARATADREDPDYASAQRAVDTISALMPQVVQDTRKLCGVKEGAAQQSLLQQVQQLCDASDAICHNAGQPQGLSDAAAKFSDASGKLMFTLSPVKAPGKEKQIMDLSAGACVRASKLLSQVQALTQQVRGAPAEDLDCRGARTADAAQALLTVAQVTSPSITSPSCRTALESAVSTLRQSAADLTAACQPHASEPGRQQLLDSHKQLNNSLDKILLACRQPSVPVVLSPDQKEKQQLHFINSLSGARSCLDDVQLQLKKPVKKEQLKEGEENVLQDLISGRLARLNAAVANLARATADRENPDYAAAQQAVDTISSLMPRLVQDTKKLSGTKDGEAQKTLLQQIQQLCDASRDICDNAGQPQGLADAAVKFADASSNMMLAVNPTPDSGDEKKIIDLSTASCVRASELLSQVQALTKQLGPKEAAALDQRGASTADAAQALLTVAQVTGPSIRSPHCSNALEAAVHSVRGSAGELTAACSPHAAPDVQRRLQAAQLALDNSLDELLEATRSAQYLQPEKQRVQFIRSVSTANSYIDEAEKQLQEKEVCTRMSSNETATLQHNLCRRLAQLNAAIAALSSATTDSKNPDYPRAERSIITITELMPRVVQESKSMSCRYDDDTRGAMQQQLQDMCSASRTICDNAHDAKKLNEAAAKFAVASGELFTVVNTAPSQDIADSTISAVKGKGPGPSVPKRAGSKPAVPQRRSVAYPVPSRNSADAQDFLNAMRDQECRENAVRVVSSESKSKTDEEKRVQQQFRQAVDDAGAEMKHAKELLSQLQSLKQVRNIEPLQLARHEQSMEETLAKAEVQVAAIVAANYANKMDQRAALEPILALTKSVTSAVDDGSAMYSSLPEHSRDSFVSDMSALCAATDDICHAALNDSQKLNDAAIAFGNQSTKLLRVVSCDVNPALEKEVIHRAKAIGDCASRMALEASTVANSAAADVTGGQRRVQDICTAGASCVDAAGKLVYTAKLVAPSMHHSTCQEALISSADTLSTNLATFSESWKPLASSSHTKTLSAEAQTLRELLERLKADVKSGRLGERKTEQHVIVVDTPLRQMTVQLMENAQSMSEHSDCAAELKAQYGAYSGQLAAALRALDLANVRCQRAPRNKNRRNELEMAIQDLQILSLQSRPSRVGQEQNNIVDFRDFLQGLVTESQQLQKTADKHQAATGKRVADDMRILCSQISEDATRLMNPSQHISNDSCDEIMDMFEFSQECDVLVKELSSAIRSVPDAKAKTQLQARLLPLAEHCNLLRFATSTALTTAKSAAFDAAQQDLEDFHSNTIPALIQHAHTVSENEKSEAVQSRSLRNRAQIGLLEATASAAAGDPLLLHRALTGYSMAACDVTTTLSEHLESMVDSVGGIVDEVCVKNNVGNLQAAARTQHDKSVYSIEEQILQQSQEQLIVPVVAAADIDTVLQGDDGPVVQGTPQ
ncbi:uncharacterized protein LOC142983900 isoform X2 [Anticarsia gemmatalis]